MKIGNRITQKSLQNEINEAGFNIQIGDASRDFYLTRKHFRSANSGAGCAVNLQNGRKIDFLTPRHAREWLLDKGIIK